MEKINSKYIHHFPDLLKKNPNLHVIVKIRTSSKSRNPEEKLERQERNILQKLSDLIYDKEILGTFPEIGQGWFEDGELQGDEREMLRQAVKYAKIREKNYGKGNVVILAESSCRFLRNKNYHRSKNIDLLPTEEEFEKLMEIADGIPLTTILHPDLPPREVRRHQSKNTRNKKAPGYKKKKRLDLLPKASKLFREGMTLREMSRNLKIPLTTIFRWKEKNYL